MNILFPSSATVSFSDETIFYQLSRIFLHPDFNKSEILKKFLFFIVKETLIGNAHSLKEYTIAVKGLDKPFGFNPQKNCIVRIHARRLRLALARYYHDSCDDDQVIIAIPKGQYVPVFMDQQQWVLSMKSSKKHTGAEQTIDNMGSVTFAILPFDCVGDDEMLKSLADSLCLQLCSSLSKVNQITVLAYQAVRSLAEKYLDLKEFGNLVGFNHIITGGISYIKGKIRITIQIIECRSYRLIWSEVFECRAFSNVFDIEDQICQRTIREVRLLANDSTVPI